MLDVEPSTRQVSFKYCFFDSVFRQVARCTVQHFATDTVSQRNLLQQYRRTYRTLEPATFQQRYRIQTNLGQRRILRVGGATAWNDVRQND